MADAKTLPEDAQERKEIPLARGLLDYFPAALAEVARVSKKGNDQHNPGQPMHHNRAKSGDHADCLMRHLLERGTLDKDGLRHSAKVAWRALALLQEEMEAAGAPLARGARDISEREAAIDKFIETLRTSPDRVVTKAEMDAQDARARRVLYGGVPGDENAVMDAVDVHARRCAVCQPQARQEIHATGVCARCDAYYPGASGRVVLLEPHFAEK